MPQLAFHVNLEACVGCNACAVACKAENKVPAGVRWRQAIAYNGGKYPAPSQYFISMACNHCTEPACLKACPVPGVITKRKEDGIVLLDVEKCIGCRRCIAACPFGAPRFDKATNKVSKCHFCLQRIEVGLPPACVATCLANALNYGEVAEVEKKYKSVKEVANVPSLDLTGANVRFTPPKL